MLYVSIAKIILNLNIRGADNPRILLVETERAQATSQICRDTNLENF
jgi:hypothetical protein